MGDHLFLCFPGCWGLTILWCVVWLLPGCLGFVWVLRCALLLVLTFVWVLDCFACARLVSACVVNWFIGGLLVLVL